MLISHTIACLVIFLASQHAVMDRDQKRDQAHTPPLLASTPAPATTATTTPKTKARKSKKQKRQDPGKNLGTYDPGAYLNAKRESEARKAVRDNSAGVAMDLEPHQGIAGIDCDASNAEPTIPQGGDCAASDVQCQKRQRATSDSDNATGNTVPEAKDMAQQFVAKAREKCRVKGKQAPVRMQMGVEVHEPGPSDHSSSALLNRVRPSVGLEANF